GGSVAKDLRSVSPGYAGDGRVRPRSRPLHHAADRARARRNHRRGLGAARGNDLQGRPAIAEDSEVTEPRSPREARRLERLKHGSRAARDVRPPPSSAPRQPPTRTPPAL